jgi:hypothetical protein
MRSECIMWENGIEIQGEAAADAARNCHVMLRMLILLECLSEAQ